MKLPKILSVGSVDRAAGFTLIELLVVIAIIAILATVGVVTYGTIQKDARDTKRKADIDVISTVLESNYGTTATPYPPLNGSLFANGFIPTPPPGTQDSLGANETNYILVSVSGDSSVWVSAEAGGDRYKVCAHLEKATGNATDADGTFINTNNGAYYCKVNQQ